MATPAMARDVRDLGAIPKHIEEVVGREALAWHSAEWWQQQWELTGLLSSVRARLQDGGWADWLRWSEETHARSGENQKIGGGSCRERECQYVKISVGAVAKKKNAHKQLHV